ncbi:MAG: hypothetical protein F9K40_12185 [Kofleriaceae bacterium]|nr:MAG: hypothetical protein F9K40_12185 [Kofleriaceae bacterium]MBZ0233677.1 hypothetical protein [Kofleriaceae bacterium]
MSGRTWTLVAAACAVLVCMAGDAHAQRWRAGDTWTFGNRCRMTWDAPGTSFTLAQDPVISTGEGSASWSDPSTGALVLYTDGISVWNASGTSIFSGLPGNPSSMHSAVVAPVPGTPGEIYVFAHDATVSSSVAYQRFSVSGAPAAVGSTGTISLPASEGREGLLLIPHANGTDAWLLVSGATSLFVVPVTAAGVGAPQQLASGLTV